MTSDDCITYISMNLTLFDYMTSSWL